MEKKILDKTPQKKTKKDTLATQKKNTFRDKHIWCADDTPYSAPHHP
jgi:hypothetical protein